MLDDLGLIHMNGRVYDPTIGRFLSADPFVQAPTETQNFNRYSYVLNNPLSLTDPSGFNFLNNFGKWLNDNLGSTGAQVAIGVISIAVGVATAGLFSWVGTAMWGAAVASGTFGGSVVAGAGFGFGSAFISSSLSGASLGQAFGSALIGGAIGAVTGGIAWELGRLNPSGEFFSLGHLEQTIGHALVGGGVSEVQGGDFGSGAFAAALSAGLAPAIDRIGNGSTDIEYIAARVSVSAALGGTAAEVAGGKFANGAVTAAFMRLYNEEHTIRERERLFQVVRDRIAHLAQDYEGSRGWLRGNISGNFAAGSDKCNKFVYDVITLAGGEVELIQRPLTGSWGIPRSVDWANRNLDMPGWRIVNDPQPGDVAAIGRANGSGHVAIVIFGNHTMSASSMVPPPGLIVRSEWGFRGDEGARVVFRRYVGF
jgi:RHS repeat-associated protein